MIIPNMFQITRSFKLWEFQDPTTKAVVLHPGLPAKLQSVRDLVDQPIIVTSSCRTWNHHKEIYKKLFPTTWQTEITIDSQHLIEPPSCTELSGEGHLNGRIIDYINNDKRRDLWICCAADIGCPGVPTDHLLSVATEVGFHFIKRYPWGLHVDLRNDLK